MVGFSDYWSRVFAMRYLTFSRSTVLPILFAIGMAHAQGQGFPVTPSTPTDFTTRNLGNSVTGASTRSEPKPIEKRKVTYTAVSKLRDWENTKGKVLSGRLLAFEPGNHEDSQKKLTLIREGKVRLLVESSKQFYDLSLDTLSKADQEYIAELVKARNEATNASATDNK